MAHAYGSVYHNPAASIARTTKFSNEGVVKNRLVIVEP